MKTLLFGNYQFYCLFLLLILHQFYCLKPVSKVLDKARGHHEIYYQTLYSYRLLKKINSKYYEVDYSIKVKENIKRKRKTILQEILYLPAINNDVRIFT